MFWLVDYVIYLTGCIQLIWLINFLRNSWKTVKAVSDLSVYGKGSWALVTACTEGIGQGFVRELAKEGFNIILVSRNPQKLQEEASYLTRNFGVETLTVVKDFSESHINPIEFFGDLYEQIRSKDISIVVNNVGSGRANFFNNYAFSEIETFSAINLWPVAFISRLIIPDMLKRDKKGAIINLGSTSSELITAKGAVYSGAKAFIKKLTLILSIDLYHAEKNNDGIDVLCLIPGYVNTPLTQKIKGKFLEIQPSECARGGLNSLGKIELSCGHWKHVITLLIGYIFVPFINMKVVRGKRQ